MDKRWLAILADARRAMRQRRDIEVPLVGREEALKGRVTQIFADDYIMVAGRKIRPDQVDFARIGD